MKALPLVSHTLRLSALLLALTSCSDGGRQVAGIEGTGDRVATGMVTGFGSVWVNGIRFDTDRAEILVGNRAASEEDLQTGQVVEIEGEITGEASGRADRIRYEPLLCGPVSEVTLQATNRRQLSLLGQVVIVPEDAVFSGLRFPDLRAGMRLEISGLRNSDFILATHVTTAPAGGVALVEGRVTQIDPAAGRLALGTQWVDISDAEFIGVTSADLALDQDLRISGPMPDEGADLAAERVALKQPTTTTPRGIQALEGLVENLDGDRFQLNGVTVVSGGAQWFRGTPEELAEGVRLSLTGPLVDGVLQATRITLLPSGISRLRGQVESIDPRHGTIQVLGNRFTGDALTGYRDTSSLGNHFFSLEDLRIGDYVEIHGSPQGDSWTATRIERLDDAGEVTLKGPVLSLLSDTEIRVMGVTVDISNADISGELTPGRLVTVFGQRSGDLILASQVTVHELPDCRFPGSFNCPPRPPYPWPPMPPPPPPPPPGGLPGR